MSHSHSHVHPEKNPDVKQHIFQFILSVVLLIVTFFTLSATSNRSLQEIRNKNPNANLIRQTEYVQAEVESIEEIESDEQEYLLEQGFKLVLVKVKILEGSDVGKFEEIEYQFNNANKTSFLKPKDRLVLTKQKTDEGLSRYFIVDKFRLTNMFILIAVFILIVIILTGLRGVNALLGLAFSVLVITNFLIPQIITSGNILWLAFITGLMIMSVSIYLAHGFNKRTSVALLGSVLTICFSSISAIIAVNFTNLGGLSTEDAFQLQFTGISNNFNFQGLLLAGIIIGSLGILDDVTTTQAASVQEISRANPKLSPYELFKRGMSIGQEHILSLINTIALAYVSVALPVLLLFTIYNQTPLWVTLNEEPIAEEIIRTLIGSLSLLLAVPITTILAAYMLKFNSKNSAEAVEKEEKHLHAHD